MHCDHLYGMGFKSAIISPLATYTARKLDKDLSRAAEMQDRVFAQLIRKAARTRFGLDHDFEGISSHSDFVARVPIRDYEGLKGYIERIHDGQQDVLWPGKPRYFAKTSGTTSGVKYIPITSASIPNHIGSARNALFNYYAQTGNGSFFDGKMIFLSGSPVLNSTAGIPTGRLSGIVNHLVPGWIRTNQMPSYATNCIEDWETKVDRIVDETQREDMRLISGIPPWVQMYYERLIEQSGKSDVGELFPNFSLFVYGGVSYAPYSAKLEELVGRNIDTLETYPASEGFIAYQDRWPSQGLRLNVNSGIFFEFIPLSEIHRDNPGRYTLRDVEIDTDYAVIINSNAGLWGYNIGDTVRFTSVNPPRLVVSGRVKHFISAFGEHVIGKEVDQAMSEACKATKATVAEFCVAPQVSPVDGGLPHHEWLIEFTREPTDMQAFTQHLERSINAQNIYYLDLTSGGILRPLQVTRIRSGGFKEFMQSKGKLGGQNKVPRLMNDRSTADLLLPYIK